MPGSRSQYEPSPVYFIAVRQSFTYGLELCVFFYHHLAEIPHLVIVRLSRTSAASAILVQLGECLGCTSRTSASISTQLSDVLAKAKEIDVFVVSP